MVLSRGSKTCTLCMTKSTKNVVAAVDEGGDSSLYDCGLGHISVKGMKVLLS